MNTGFQYIKEHVEYSIGRKKAFWSFEGQAHCAATVWTFLALKKMKQLNYNQEIIAFYDQNLEKGIEFVLGNIPPKCIEWKEEQIVYEAGAKYNKQKNYYSFSPTLLLDLFELGVTPYHPKIIMQIKWLISHEKQWKIEKYDRSEVCSFTYGMVLSVLAKWEILVGQENAQQLVRNSNGKFDYFFSLIFGMPVFKDSCVQMVMTSRLINCWLLSLLVLLFCFKGKDIYFQIVTVVEPILVFFLGAQDSIIVNVLSSFVYAGLLFLGTMLFKTLQFIFGRRH